MDGWKETIHPAIHPSDWAFTSGPTTVARCCRSSLTPTTGEVVSDQVFYPVDTPFLNISYKFVQNWNFAKTVYAGAEIHRDVREVMKRVMEGFPGLNITTSLRHFINPTFAPLPLNIK